uniref:Nuclear pore protein n=1 Tax=Caenorhabditis tropicalis TaxID=1561998 RepID=A0A1I7T7G4_9PELO
MLQKLSLTPKRNHENEVAKSIETEEELLHQLKAMQTENDYLHMWMTYEKLAALIVNRSTEKTRRPEYGKLMFYYQSAAQNLAKIWKRDSVLPFEQYNGGDVARLYNKALDVAVRYMDPTVVHTVAREAGLALLSIGKPIEARDAFIRGEQQLVAVPADVQPDFLERLILLYGIMDTILIEERWNEYMVYTDKIWMMTMKEDKRCPLLENIIKEVEQIAVLLLVFQKKVESSERHRQLVASYRLDDWKAPVSLIIDSLMEIDRKGFR